MLTLFWHRAGVCPCSYFFFSFLFLLLSGHPSKIKKFHSGFPASCEKSDIVVTIDPYVHMTMIGSPL